MNLPHAVSHSLAFIGGFSGWELVIILVIALLLFGRRLPEVGKSLGKGIVEFKKGLKGIEEEVDQASSQPSPNARRQNELPREPAYRAPLDAGQDRRVSRADVVEEPLPGSEPRAQ